MKNFLFLVIVFLLFSIGVVFAIAGQNGPLITVKAVPERAVGAIEIWTIGGIDAMCYRVPVQFSCFDYGDEVYLRADPKPGYRFSYWNFRTEADNLIHFSNERYRLLTAHFERIPPEDMDFDYDGYSPSQGDCDDYDSSVYPGYRHLLIMRLISLPGCE